MANLFVALCVALSIKVIIDGRFMFHCSISEGLVQKDFISIEITYTKVLQTKTIACRLNVSPHQQSLILSC